MVSRARCKWRSGHRPRESSPRYRASRHREAYEKALRRMLERVQPVLNIDLETAQHALRRRSGTN